MRAHVAPSGYMQVTAAAGGVAWACVAAGLARLHAWQTGKHLAQMQSHVAANGADAGDRCCQCCPWGRVLPPV